jgi:hypothetical protein
MGHFSIKENKELGNERRSGENNGVGIRTTGVKKRTIWCM